MFLSLSTPWTRLRCERAVECPAIHIKPRLERVVFDAEFRCPISNQHRTAIECYRANVAPIALLFTTGRPAAIIRTISAVVIDAFDGMAKWTLAHIGQEIIEVFPPLANRDSAAAVIVESAVVWIRAALPHVAPNIIETVA